MGIVTRHTKVPATQVIKELQLNDEERLTTYVNKLLEKAILIKRGVKKGTEYLINPKLISSSKINIRPTLKTIEPHRLKALIIEDLERYPKSMISDISKRLPDVLVKDIRNCVYKMVEDNIVKTEGANKNRTYLLA